MEEKIQKLVEDQEFVTKMLSCEEPEQVQKLFADNGVEVSLEEVKALGQSLATMAESDGELSEDDLEGVAGGSLLGAVSTIISAGKLVKTVVDNWSTIKSWFRRW